VSAVKRIASFFSERRILLGIVFAIIIAFVMTVISLRLYDLDDVSRLDVSLPNRESIRSAASADEVQKFDSSGPLDSKALSDFQNLYTKNRSALDALGKYDADALSSDSLQIGPNE
jgi:hypothetical protein